MNEQISGLWEKAQASTLGLKVKTDDPKLLRDQLRRWQYSNRKEELEGFELSIVAQDTLLIKRKPNATAPRRKPD